MSNRAEKVYKEILERYKHNSNFYLGLEIQWPVSYPAKIAHITESASRNDKHIKVIYIAPVKGQFRTKKKQCSPALFIYRSSHSLPMADTATARLSCHVLRAHAQGDVTWSLTESAAMVTPFLPRPVCFALAL